MGRTQAELLAWSARVRSEAVEIQEQARATREATQLTRARLARLPREPVTTVPPSGRVVASLDDLPLEESAERALLRQFTAEEIADHVGIPVRYVLRAATDNAACKQRSLDDTLRSWFHALLA